MQDGALESDFWSGEWEIDYRDMDRSVGGDVLLLVFGEDVIAVVRGVFGNRGLDGFSGADEDFLPMGLIQDADDGDGFVRLLEAEHAQELRHR